MEILTAVREAFGGDDTGPGDGTPTERDLAATAEFGGGDGDGDEDATACVSKAEFVVSTGQTRTEALLELVEAHEGRVRQSELVELTGWSKATVSRRLSELERDGAIDRVQIGRCKVVLLPGEPLAGEHAITYDVRDTNGARDASDRRDTTG